MVSARMKSTTYTGLQKALHVEVVTIDEAPDYL